MMSTTPTVFVRIASLILAMFGTATASANTAVTLPDPDSLLQQQPVGVSVLGYEFFTANDIDITAIGILDSASDGLSSPHTVVIWDESEEIVFQLIVPIGAGSLNDGFRYIDINPLALTGDTKYVIGVTYFGGNMDAIAVANFSSDYQLDPAITITNGRTGLGTGFPLSASSEIYFGPNFIFTQVPVPGAVWLLASALGLLGISRRRPG